MLKKRLKKVSGGLQIDMKNDATVISDSVDITQQMQKNFIVTGHITDSSYNNQVNVKSKIQIF